MRIRSRAVLVGLALSIAIIGAACPKRTSIADIQSNPSRFQDKEVAIVGTVRDSYGLNIPGSPLRGGIYKVDDGTGSIWVLTQEGVPSKGAQIGVKGVVGNGVNWNGRNYGLGLYEKDRRFARR